MKNLNQTKKSLLKLSKETVSNLSDNADKTCLPTETIITTSRLCFGLAMLAERQ